jgi:hypothetical protein
MDLYRVDTHRISRTYGLILRLGKSDNFHIDSTMLNTDETTIYGCLPPGFDLSKNQCWGRRDWAPKARCLGTIRRRGFGGVTPDKICKSYSKMVHFCSF